MQWDGSKWTHHRLGLLLPSIVRRYRESAANYAKEKGITPLDCSKAAERSPIFPLCPPLFGEFRVSGKCPLPLGRDALQPLSAVHHHLVPSTPRFPLYFFTWYVSLLFSLPSSSGLALLGANWCGKTTTLRRSQPLRSEPRQLTKGRSNSAGQRVDR